MVEELAGGAPGQPWYRRRPVREILWVLAFKVVAMTALYLAFFQPSETLPTGPDSRPPFLSSATIATDTRGGDV